MIEKHKIKRHVYNFVSSKYDKDRLIDENTRIKATVIQLGLKKQQLESTHISA